MTVCGMKTRLGGEEVGGVFSFHKHPGAMKTILAATLMLVATAATADWEDVFTTIMPCCR